MTEVDDNEFNKKYFGGSPECTEENLLFFVEKIRELNRKGTKLTFRQWLRKLMALIDLID